MAWRSLGIIVSFRKIGEKGGIAEIFTANHGKYEGWSPQILLAGDFVHCSYNEKNENELGSWQTESCTNIFVDLSSHNFGSLVLASICELLKFNLPPRTPHDRLFLVTWETLYQLHNKNVVNIVQSYLEWEEFFIQEMGFSLEEELKDPNQEITGQYSVELETNCFFEQNFVLLKWALKNNVKASLFAREILYEMWKEYAQSC